MNALMKKTGGHEPYITADQLARALSVHPTSIKNWQRQGMPHYRLSERVRRFRLSEVLEWSANRWRQEQEGK